MYRYITGNKLLCLMSYVLYIPTMGLPVLLEEICRLILGIYKCSKTHKCGNWGWSHAIPRKGIYKRNCSCSVRCANPFVSGSLIRTKRRCAGSGHAACNRLKNTRIGALRAPMLIAASLLFLIKKWHGVKTLDFELGQNIYWVW